MPASIPIGSDRFRRIREDRLESIDKSRFTQEFLDDIGTRVLLLPRPRRFGKTVNMTMLEAFLAMSPGASRTSLKVSMSGLRAMPTEGISKGIPRSSCPSRMTWRLRRADSASGEGLSHGRRGVPRGPDRPVGAAGPLIPGQRVVRSRGAPPYI